MTLTAFERLGVWLMRLGMKWARIDYVDAQRQFTFPNGHGHISQGFWRR